MTDLATIEQLKNRDFTLLIDKSSSMMTTDTPQGSRWKAAQEMTLGLAHKMNEFDPDGITVVPFANRFKRHDNVQPSTVENLWKEHEPNGSTNTALALKDTLDNFFYRKQRGQSKPNGELICVVTDGIPDDEAEVRRVIIDASKKMDRDSELGILFLQVGKDTAATAFLKRCDDGLVAEGAKFDIVDTVTAEEASERTLTDLFLGALND